MWGKESGPDLKSVFPKSFFEDRRACGDLLRECSHDVIMMGTQKSEAQLFSYAVNLAKRVRANHPPRLTTSALSPFPMADTWPWPHSSPIPLPMMTREMRSSPAWPKPPGIVPNR
jgi:hypothetical protein